MLNMYQISSLMAPATGPVAEFSSIANLEEKKRKSNLLMSFPKTVNQMGSFGQIRKKNVFSLLSADSRYFRIYALKKLEDHLNLWKSRSLSLVGKSLIVNTIGISKLLYLATILPVPKWVISEVNNLIWPFLWGCRMETVSRQSCHQPFLKGSLGIINFKIKADPLKLASVVSNCSNADSKSFYLVKYFFGAKLSPIRPEWRSLRVTPLRVLNF